MRERELFLAGEGVVGFGEAGTDEENVPGTEGDVLSRNYLLEVGEGDGGAAEGVGGWGDGVRGCPGGVV